MIVVSSGGVNGTNRRSRQPAAAARAAAAPRRAAGESQCIGSRRGEAGVAGLAVRLDNAGMVGMRLLRARLLRLRPVSQSQLPHGITESTESSRGGYAASARNTRRRRGGFPRPTWSPKPVRDWPTARVSAAPVAAVCVRRASVRQSPSSETRWLRFNWAAWAWVTADRLEHARSDYATSTCKRGDDPCRQRGPAAPRNGAARLRPAGRRIWAKSGPP